MSIPGPQAAAAEFIPTTTWERVDLRPYARGEISEPDPCALWRSDGVALFYPGKLHWLSGEPESGKSWVAAIVAGDALADGQNAIYIDFEGEPTAIVERLIALGVPLPAIENQLAYFRPETPMSDEVVAQVLETAKTLQPFVSVIDGVGAGMGVSGYDSNKALDFYGWWNRLGQPLCKLTSGPTLANDHVVKDVANRNGYSVGTGQKQAAIDVHIGIEVSSPFGIGLTGRLRLVLQKDRAGRIRRHQAPDKTIGTLVLESDPETRKVLFAIDPPSGMVKAFRPTVLMERVSRYVEVATEPPTKNQIRITVPGKVSGLVAAVERLHEEGFIRVEVKGRYGVFHSVKPFRIDEDLAAYNASGDGRSQLFPCRSRNAGEVGVPPFPPFKGTGYATTQTAGQNGSAVPSDGLIVLYDLDETLGAVMDAEARGLDEEEYANA